MPETKASVEVIANLRLLPLHRNPRRHSSRAGGRANGAAKCRGAGEVSFEAITGQTQRSEVCDVWRPKTTAVVEGKIKMFNRRNHCSNSTGKIMNSKAVIRPKRCAADERTVR